MAQGVGLLRTIDRSKQLEIVHIDEFGTSKHYYKAPHPVGKQKYSPSAKRKTKGCSRRTGRVSMVEDKVKIKVVIYPVPTMYREVAGVERKCHDV